MNSCSLSNSHRRIFNSFGTNKTLVKLVAVSLFIGGAQAQETGVLLRLERLESNFIELQQALAVSLLASTEPCGGLPGKWIEAPNFVGKFVLGASEDYPAGSEGGTAKVQLSIKEMPAHRHGMPMVTTPHGYQDVGLGTNAPYFDYSRRPDVKTKIGDSRSDQGVYETGGNEAHENMPPYRVVYFCKLVLQ